MKFYAEKTSKFSVPNDLGTKVRVDEIRRFIIDCLLAVGTRPAHAYQLADVLVAADVRGHYSHGLNRIELYVHDVEQNICNGETDPEILKESVSTALVDGKNTLGPVVGTFAMNLAIRKAKESGIGWVAARNSNHYGIAGWYAMLASKEGLIGMSFSNAFPVVVPTGAKQKCFGTNPIAVAAPSLWRSEPFVLDMSTSVVPVGKIEVQNKKKEPIPEGWALNKEGNPTTDPSEALSGSLMPLGGLDSGHKGYGLAMTVEVLCGILSGSNYGSNIKQWNEPTTSNLGQGFVAIDPTFFAPGFTNRMTDLMDHCRNLEPVDPSKPVWVPGDPERTHEQNVEMEGGITYHINQIKDCYLLAKYLGVAPLKSRNATFF